MFTLKPGLLSVLDGLRLRQVLDGRHARFPGPFDTSSVTRRALVRLLAGVRVLVDHRVDVGAGSRTRVSLTSKPACSSDRARLDQLLARHARHLDLVGR